MNVIDLEKLENLVTTSTGWQARCAACAENGEDSHNKNHLGIQRDGKFNCLKYSGDKEHLARILQLVGTESDGSHTAYLSPEPKIQVPKNWPISLLDKLIFDYSYFEKRGVSAATQKYFRMGVALGGQLNKRVVLPVFNKEKTQITGFSGRLIDYSLWHKENGVGKWKHLGEIRNATWPYEPQEIQKANSIILVESPGCVLWLWEQGIKNVLCLFGVNISSKIIAYLISLNPARILISTNNELGSSNMGVGNKKALQIRETLTNFFSEERVLVALPDVKDFGDYHSLSENSEIKFDNWREKWLN